MKRTVQSWCLVLGAAIVLHLAGCVVADDWRSTELRGHPLAGRILDVREARDIGREALIGRLARADVVLLGETHDNADHHRLQSAVLTALTSRGRQPALVMEQFDLEHQGAIDASLRAPGADAQSVAEAGKMREGWNRSFYEPMIARAIDRGLPVVAANLSRESARTLMRAGIESLGAGRVRQLALEAAWDAGREERLRRDIVEGHCGQVPDDLLPRLVMAQRARDALMADAMLAHGGRGVVGIVGRGHARRDLGVPRYLALRDAKLDVVSVGFVEVDRGKDRVEDYGADLAQFDYLWFTPRAQRKDPCAGFSIPAGR